MLERLWRGTSRTVLMVSAREPDCSLDGAFLHRPPIRLLTGNHDQRSLKLARRKRPSLIIDDLQTGDGGGLDFCRWLRDDPRTRAIPLVVVAEPGLGELARECDPTLLLVKPVRRYEFFKAVRRFVPMPKRRAARCQANLRFSFRTAEMCGQAFSRDVSLSGAFLKTDRIPSLHGRVDLAFRLPGRQESVRCVGTVVRVNDGKRTFDGSENGFAVEFEEIADADVGRIEAFIGLLGRGRLLEG